VFKAFASRYGGDDKRLLAIATRCGGRNGRDPARQQDFGRWDCDGRRFAGGRERGYVDKCAIYVQKIDRNSSEGGPATEISKQLIR